MTIVDDGPTDETADVVAGCADRRVHLIRQPNAGVSAARNRGFANTTGERVLFLDGDDCLEPDALARLAATLDAAPECVAAYGAFCFVTESGTPVHYKRDRFRAATFSNGCSKKTCSLTAVIS